MDYLLSRDLRKLKNSDLNLRPLYICTSERRKVSLITITNVTAWSIDFWSNGGYFDTRKEHLVTQSEAECSQLFLSMSKYCPLV